MNEQQAKFIEAITNSFKGKADIINEADKKMFVPERAVIKPIKDDDRELIVGKEKEEVEEDYISDLGNEQDKLSKFDSSNEAASIVSQYNEIAESKEQDDWDDDFAFPVMEVESDNKTVRFEYRVFEGAQEGWRKVVKHITAEQAKQELGALKNEQDEGIRFHNPDKPKIAMKPGTKAVPCGNCGKPVDNNEYTLCPACREPKKKLEEEVQKLKYNEIVQLPEYKALIDTGLTDVTGPIQKNRASAVMFDSENYRYTVHSNGKIRRAKVNQWGVNRAEGVGLSSTIAEGPADDWAALMKVLADRVAKTAVKTQKKEWNVISGSHGKVAVPDDLINYMIAKMEKKGYMLGKTTKNNFFGNDAILYDFKKKGRKEITIWFEAFETSWRKGVSAINLEDNPVEMFHDKNGKYTTTSDPVWIKSGINKALAKIK